MEMLDLDTEDFLLCFQRTPHRQHTTLYKGRYAPWKSLVMVFITTTKISEDEADPWCTPVHNEPTILAGCLTVQHSDPINDYVSYMIVVQNKQNYLTRNRFNAFLKVKENRVSSSHNVSLSVGRLQIWRVHSR